ncbi:DUF411 domain-containing protein [Roseisolibacter sp. H3M3-2]|uniref:DUF411 domain-containing protein n=1 Tax=Roseisolibacter sp. H3M3-2 TaxID=3031323 RepID=UPI0023DB8D9A|nr:DUF411 domain-containing protein [Roseisolibacter sp. H3M3-2]MDF1503675.1 DUF411 domain-containing protein [Roseisolibacter sp. H3M3-2]
MSDVLTRRAWLAGAAAGAAGPAAAPVAALAAAPAPGPTMTIYKSPTCGCCQKWVMHVAAAGFRTAVNDVEDLDAIKRRHGVPADLQSCHTAVVGGYVVEGHVPAADVQRLLKDRPKVKGIAVGGMPAGSPGMEMPGRSDKYDVTAFRADGSTYRFASH